MAGSIARKAGHGFVGEETWWTPTEEKWQAAGVNSEDVEDAFVSASDAMAAAIAALSV